MLKLQKQVLEFMTYFGQDFSLTPRVPSKATFDLSVKLIEEELVEFMEAKSLVDIADALGDLAYVGAWAANAWGLRLEHEPITKLTIRNRKLYWSELIINNLSDYTFRIGLPDPLPVRPNHMLSRLMARVIYAAEDYGLGPVFERVTDEIHRSNLSKAWTQEDVRTAAYFIEENKWVVSLVPNVGIGIDDDPGHLKPHLFAVRSESGKIIKSPNYSKADLSFVEVAA